MTESLPDSGILPTPPSKTAGTPAIKILVALLILVLLTAAAVGGYFVFNKPKAKVEKTLVEKIEENGLLDSDPEVAQRLKSGNFADLRPGTEYLYYKSQFSYILGRYYATGDEKILALTRETEDYIAQKFPETYEIDKAQGGFEIKER